jgi:hypothetical protein
MFMHPSKKIDFTQNYNKPDRDSPKKPDPLMNTHKPKKKKAEPLKIEFSSLESPKVKHYPFNRYQQVESLVVALYEELKCAICLDPFTDPRILNLCGHTFCLGCIVQIERNSSSELKCPICGRFNVIPVTATDDLPRNFVAMRGVEKLKTLTQAANNKPVTNNNRLQSLLKTSDLCVKCNGALATDGCLSKYCRACCYDKHCAIHTRCAKCKFEKVECILGLCYRCCTDRLCEYHYGCVGCTAYATPYCVQQKCRFCCNNPRCPVHYKSTHCGNPACKNVASSECPSIMCGVCCTNPDCFHSISALRCIKCHINVAPAKCSARNCDDCCKKRWCQLHGKPVLCSNCNWLADDNCLGGFCQRCCSKIACPAHGTNV